MKRQPALVTTIILFMIFFAIVYYGARITLWSSIIFSTFITLILLYYLYPPRNLMSDQPDFSLVLYAAFFALGMVAVFVYLIYKTLSDFRHEPECDPLLHGGCPPPHLLLITPFTFTPIQDQKIEEGCQSNMSEQKKVVLNSSVNSAESKKGEITRTNQQDLSVLLGPLP